MKSFRGRPSTGRHRSRGQAVVEFALIIPLFLLLLAGMIDFGIAMYDYMTIVNAARDGARIAASTCGTATPACTATVRSHVTPAGGISPSVTISCTTPANAPTSCDSGAAKGGGSVTVTARYTYQMIWPLAFGTQIPMGYTAKFMVQ